MLFDNCEISLKLKVNKILTETRVVPWTLPPKLSVGRIKTEDSFFTVLNKYFYIGNVLLGNSLLTAFMFIVNLTQIAFSNEIIFPRLYLVIKQSCQDCT